MPAVHWCASAGVTNKLFARFYRLGVHLHLDGVRHVLSVWRIDRDVVDDSLARVFRASCGAVLVAVGGCELYVHLLSSQQHIQCLLTIHASCVRLRRVERVTTDVASHSRHLLLLETAFIVLGRRVFQGRTEMVTTAGREGHALGR